MSNSLNVDWEAAENLFDEYEQSKWVRFDLKDQSTWPDSNKSILAYGSDGSVYTTRLKVMLKQRKYTSNGYESLNTTHWQPLPQTPKQLEEEAP